MPNPPTWVNRYVGIPYVPGGRDHSGVDCWGLVALVGREQFDRNIPMYDGTWWDEGADRKAIADYMCQQKTEMWTEIAVPDIGDVALINMLGVPMHVGVVVEHGLMLHCERGCNSCVESYRSPRWVKRIEGFYRFRM